MGIFSDFRALISNDSGKPTTTSFAVAKAFNKHHKNVIQAIERLGCSADFAKLNFQLCYENNKLQNGKPQKFYQMTKDGWMFLVMGFKGKDAAVVKEGFINAFNWMLESISSIGVNKMQHYNYLSLKFLHKKMDVSFAALTMRNWQDEQPEMLAQMAILEREIQPMLSLFEEETNANPA